ncbi:MAG: hypothetical protein ACXWV1_13595, partial [Chitinophagaceae bacterium]
ACRRTYTLHGTGPSSAPIRAQTSPRNCGLRGTPSRQAARVRERESGVFGESMAVRILTITPAPENPAENFQRDVQKK